jgi:hypothetical protein
MVSIKRAQAEARSQSLTHLQTWTLEVLYDAFERFAAITQLALDKRDCGKAGEIGALVEMGLVTHHAQSKSYRITDSGRKLYEATEEERAKLELDEEQDNILGRLYDGWAEDPGQTIRLAVARGSAALFLAGKGLASQHRPERGDLFQYSIRRTGRRWYERNESKRAATYRSYWIDGKAEDTLQPERIAEMLRSLGYSASLFETSESLTVEILQTDDDGGMTTPRLSLKKACDLIACPLRHPLRLADFERRSTGESWYEFPGVDDPEGRN